MLGPGPKNFLPLGAAFSFFLMWSLVGAGMPSGAFRLFLVAAGLFALGNSSVAFMLLLAQRSGWSPARSRRSGTRCPQKFECCGRKIINKTRGRPDPDGDATFIMPMAPNTA